MGKIEPLRRLHGLCHLTQPAEHKEGTHAAIADSPSLLCRSQAKQLEDCRRRRTSRRRRPRCSRYAAHTKHGRAERYLRYGLVRIRALAQSASGQPEVSSPGAPRTPPHVPNLCFPERNEAPVKTLWVKRQPRPQDTITQSHSQLIHRYNIHTCEDRLALTGTQWLVLWLAHNHTSSNTHIQTC